MGWYFLSQIDQQEMMFNEIVALFTSAQDIEQQVGSTDYWSRCHSFTAMKCVHEILCRKIKSFCFIVRTYQQVHRQVGDKKTFETTTTKIRLHVT